MVAFATSGFTRVPYAIKFFASRTSFDAELAMRLNSTVRWVAPEAAAVFDPAETAVAVDGGIGATLLHPDSSSSHLQLPPGIVMPRGESLVEWSRRALPDVFQAVPVRPAVSSAIWGRFLRCNCQ